MAKTRMINTRFWDDGYIADLDPTEKLLFLYFLTNPTTSICGIYELPLKTVALDTGLDKEMVSKIINRFTADGKIFYIDGWVYVRNFQKHQSSASTSVQKGIKMEMEKIPQKIRVKIDKIQENEIEIDPIGRVSGRVIYLNPNLNSNTNTKSTRSPKAENDDLTNEAITLFEAINPSYQSLFPRKPQREAAKRLVKIHGLDGLEQIVAFLQAHQGERFLPSIGTPCQLEDKWASLQSFAKKEKLTGALL